MSQPSGRAAAFLACAVLAGALSIAPAADGCTTILVGSALTADGAVLHAHNEDMGNDAVGRVWWTAAAEHLAEERLAVPYVELLRAEETLGYWAAGNAAGTTGLGTAEATRPYDSVLVGLNEAGVSLSCNWAHSRAENRPGVGIRRYALRQLLLERATSARHGVELLGDWIETHGQADWGGLIYHLADTREAWVVETTTRNWVARRVGDREIHVTANRFRIGADYDLSSPTLVADAVAAGWIEENQERISFADTYGRPDKMNQPYDTRREARTLELLEPKRGSITPEHLFPILRDRYEGTDHYTPPQAQPVWREDLDARPDISRTISTNLAQSTFVAHLRPGLPTSLGAVLWLGLGTPNYAAYVPLYAGGGHLPDEYSSQSLEETEASAWWLFRRLQREADPEYERRYPEVRAFWQGKRAHALERLHQVESEAQAEFDAGNHTIATGLLSGLTHDLAAAALCGVRQLLASACSDDNEQILNRGEGKDLWWQALPRPIWSRFRRVEQSQPWFEVYEIRPGVLAIYEPGQFEEVISYLILGSERAVLFDTGLGIANMKKLVSELTDRPVVVLNSHTHYDHVGGNHAFEEIYGTDTDYTRRNARGRAPEEVAEFVGPGWIWKPTPPDFVADEYDSEPFSISHRVTDGEIVSLGDVEIEILLTPGHAPDSLCLLDRDRGLLFTGDTFYPATLYAHLPGSAFDTYRATAERLAALSGSIEVVLPGHNEPVMEPSELVRLGRAFSEIQEPSTTYALTDGNREYDFATFSILVSDPPPWDER